VFALIHKLVTFTRARGEYKYLIDSNGCAVEEARAANLVGAKHFGLDFSAKFTRTPARAICGEETALLSSLAIVTSANEAAAPAVSSLYGPTVVNNVETLTAVPQIIEMGGGGA